MSERQDSLQQYVNDMLAVERHIDQLDRHGQPLVRLPTVCIRHGGPRGVQSQPDSGRQL